MVRIMLVLVLGVMLACDEIDRQGPKATADSGVVAARAQIETGSDGLTVEQRNVKERLRRDNLPGSIKHLYVISPYSGQVLIYSTVKGKVTSSGKRLTPKTMLRSWATKLDSNGTMQNDQVTYEGVPVKMSGRDGRTAEVLQDDGVYGDSVEYLYWFDARGVYHQHYLGDEILHVSDQPLAVKSVLMNFELTSASETPVDESAQPEKR